MKISFIGKRFYTNRDALQEQYGRIFQLPFHWNTQETKLDTWFIDYHSNENFYGPVDGLNIRSTPVMRGTFWKSFVAYLLQPHMKSNVIVASGDCYIGLVAYLIARKQGAKFVFDVYDKYDEFEGYHSIPGFDLFRFLLRHADLRLFASRALMQDLSPKPDHDLLVPNGVDIRQFKPKNQNTSRQEIGLPQDVLLVGYFGGMEQDRGIADLIEAIALLRDEGMTVELLLGGKPPIDLEVDKPGVCFLGDIPYKRMPTVLASCDLLAVPYRRSALMDAGASNKIVEAIACQRPLVATRTPNFIANFPKQIERLEGLLADPGNASDIARVIRGQAENRILVDMPTDTSWNYISHNVLNRLILLAKHSETPR